MEKIGTKEYFAVVGSHFSDRDAQVIGPEIERIAIERGGVRPEDVVEEARNQGSSLHNYFEWNDQVAAEAYRLDQARYMLRSIKIKIEDQETITEIRAFMPVKTEPNQERKKYLHIETIVANPNLVDQITAEALGELQTWHEKWNVYRSLYSQFEAKFSPVFKAIDEAV